MSPVERGRSSVSCGLVHSLQQATEIRQRESGPGLSLGRSKESNSSVKGRPSGFWPKHAGPAAKILNASI